MAKSTLNPTSPFVTATIELEVAKDRVVVRHVAIDVSGGVDRGVYALHPDGQAHDQGNGYSLTARWRDARTLEFTALKNGQSAGQGSYEASADGRTLTISGEGQLIVCERTERSAT